VVFRGARDCKASRLFESLLEIQKQKETANPLDSEGMIGYMHML
jgi:hypothetical protein